MIKAVLLLGLLAVAATVADESTASDECLTCTSSWEQECSLYMAPSTIPGAGYGLYTGVDVEEGEAVGEPDVVIPVLDKFKTLPYRGQQQFLSWLGYVWPAKPDYFYNATTASFPTIPKSFYKVDPGLNGATSLKFRDEDQKRVSAFAPGIASLVNSGTNNIKSVKSSEEISFVARNDLEAGEELFLYYGDKWHKRHENKLKSETTFSDLDDYNKDVLPKLKLPTEQDKRAKLAKQERTKLETDDDDDFDGSISGGYRVFRTIKDYIDTVLFRKEDGVEQVVEVTDEQQPVTTPKRDIEWLKQNGMCVDNLRIGKSKKLGAARFTEKEGAFSKKFIPKGERIAPAPLLVLKWEDLTIYEADETQKAYRNVLNFEKIKGYEELTNFCYGHPDSEILLLPYSPVVNYINHGGKQPNAEIRWPKDAPWLDLHPVDVLEMSGKLMMEFVALRDIEPDEEIVIDLGKAWEEEWREHREDYSDMDDFRHEIVVPGGFFPDAWKDQSVEYELAKSPLKPGELELMRWKHNGKPVCKHCYRVGLPSGFSQHFRDFAEERGIARLYDKLLHNPILKSDEWSVFDTMEEQWFAQRFMNKAWDFNMHYIAAWDEAARMSFLRALGTGGFDTVLESIGTKYGLDNMTVFHLSFMGITEADDSFTHTDVYATNETGFNIIWPMSVVEGSSPELDIVSDDTNIVLSVNYEYDVAYVMGDYGYHKTSPNSYEDKGQMRIVIGAYAGQIDDTNRKMYHHIYDGEDPAPFCGQFASPDIHWDSNGGHGLPK